ncbi:MAG: DUF4984 domain-containing protein [Bacteroidales bacterium]
MKKLSLYPLAVLFLFAAVLTGCQEEKVTFSGNDYVMFSDTLQYMPVTENAENMFEVLIGTSKKADIDRTYAVELVLNKSNAIEGHHFDLVSNNVVVKAGELTGKVQIKGYYDNITYGDSLAFTLRLLTDKNQEWDMYGKETNVSLIKCMPFDIDNFVGNLKMYASFPFNNSVVTFYVKSEKMDDSTLLVKDAFSGKYDLELRFKKNDANPFQDGVTVPNQAAFADPSYGQVFTRTVENAPSFYVTYVRTICLYMEMYVPETGSFGVYQYMFQWVPQSEVDAANNSTGTPFMMNNEAFDFRHIGNN